MLSQHKNKNKVASNKCSIDCDKMSQTKERGKEAEKKEYINAFILCENCTKTRMMSRKKNKSVKIRGSSQSGREFYQKHENELSQIQQEREQ